MFPQVFGYTKLRKALQALKGVIHVMTADQIIQLQEAYKELKATSQCESHPFVEQKIELAMNHIRLALQKQGVFVS